MSFQQVQRVPELGRPHPKIPSLRHRASDTEIADWCALHEWVLITYDHDFRSRGLRMGAYLGRGVDVILCGNVNPPARESTRAAGSHRVQLCEVGRRCSERKAASTVVDSAWA